MILAIFDLDNTLLGGDSDYSWGQFLVERDIVDANSYKRANDQFYEDYKAGQLDMAAYVAFALQPLVKLSRTERDELHQQFMQEKIEPLLLPKAFELIEKHKSLGHTLLIITATNHFITGPIAKRLGIEHLIATDAEIIDDHYTGKMSGIPCYQEGKITRLDQWLKEKNIEAGETYFYSDSFNDLPLLKQVSYPYAVDPDDTLRKHAEENNWPIISLR